jgi:DNA-binding NarL/FixJ family response regulator
MKPDGRNIRVLIVDDSDLYRAGLRELLGAAGLEVVGEAGTGEDGVRLAREGAPDVVLMDVDMPGAGGVEATREIASTGIRSAVVILTASADEEDVLAAVVAGAQGYLLKSAPVEELVAGVRAAAVGAAIISPSIAAQLLQRLRKAHPGTRTSAALSERELEIVRLLGRGMDTRAIAAELHLSRQTVKNAVAQILRKLGLRNRTEAAVYAVRVGL